MRLRNTAGTAMEANGTAIRLAMRPIGATLPKTAAVIGDVPIVAPALAASAFHEFVTLFFHENRLMTGGLEIGGRGVDVAAIQQPVFNVYALRDHIVPPAAARALADLLPHAPYAEFAVDAGHIGTYVSRGAAAQVPRRIANWLKG